MKANKLIIALTLSSALILVGLVVGYTARPWLNPSVSFTVQFHNEMSAFHQRVAANFSGEEIVFLGDSHTQGLAVHRVVPNSINFGVGSLQTNGVISQLEKMPTLTKANQVVIGIGFNDLRQMALADVIEQYERLLAMFNNETQVTVLAVMPIDERFIRAYSIVEAGELNGLIAEFNQQLAGITEQRPNTLFVDTYSWMLEDSRLPAKWHNDDGVHLSPAGYERLILLLNRAIAQKGMI